MQIKLLAAAVLLAACAKGGPKTDTLPGPQLGESTASPGANPSKPQPVTPDDPRVMNVSAGITPAQARAAAQAPLPTTQNPPAAAATSAPAATSAAPAAPATATPATATPTADTTVRAPATSDPATSSTPVTQPTDIAPPSTTAPVTPQPNVFSPPPPPPQ